MTFPPTVPGTEAPIYQCDYWWRGLKCSHLTWLAHCPRHDYDTHQVGLYRVLGQDGGSE